MTKKYQSILSAKSRTSGLEDLKSSLITYVEVADAIHSLACLCESTKIARFPLKYNIINNYQKIFR